MIYEAAGVIAPHMYAGTGLPQGQAFQDNGGQFWQKRWRIAQRRRHIAPGNASRKALNHGGFPNRMFRSNCMWHVLGTAGVELVRYAGHRIPGKNGVKLLAGNLEDFRLVDGDDRRRSRLPGEKGHFSEIIPGMERGQEHLIA